MENIKDYLIVPSEKDVERVKAFSGKSNAQVESEIFRVKDANKLAKRWVASHTFNRFSFYDYTFKRAMIRLGIKEDSELMLHTQATIKVWENEWKEKEKLKEEAFNLRVKPARDIIDAKVISKVKKMSRNTILNSLGLNKKMFGDEVRMSNAKVEYHAFQHYGGTHIPIRVTCKFEHLNGYFFRDMDYKLILEMIVKEDGTSHFKRGYRIIARLGKKDTETIMEVVTTFFNK